MQNISQAKFPQSTDRPRCIFLSTKSRKLYSNQEDIITQIIIISPNSRGFLLTKGEDEMRKILFVTQL